MKSDELKELDEIDHFLIIGEYERAEEKITKLEKIDELKPNKNRLMLLKSRLLNSRGEYAQAIIITEKILEELEEQEMESELQTVSWRKKVDTLNVKIFSTSLFLKC